METKHTPAISQEKYNSVPRDYRSTWTSGGENHGKRTCYGVCLGLTGFSGTQIAIEGKDFNIITYQPKKRRINHA